MFLMPVNSRLQEKWPCQHCIGQHQCVLLAAPEASLRITCRIWAIGRLRESWQAVRDPKPSRGSKALHKAARHIRLAVIRVAPTSSRKDLSAGHQIMCIIFKLKYVRDLTRTPLPCVRAASGLSAAGTPAGCGASSLYMTCPNARPFEPLFSCSSVLSTGVVPSPETALQHGNTYVRSAGYGRKHAALVHATHFLYNSLMGAHTSTQPATLDSMHCFFCPSCPVPFPDGDTCVRRQTAMLRACRAQVCSSSPVSSLRTAPLL